jgi:RNA polymerase subunit RPABC4/transcription elongation factor Spt4
MVYLEELAGKVCPGCRSVLSQDFEYCPSCGEFVGDHCESCRRRLNPEWTFCPSCGAGAPGHAAEPDGSHADGQPVIEVLPSARGVRRPPERGVARRKAS